MKPSILKICVQNIRLFCLIPCLFFATISSIAASNEEKISLELEKVTIGKVLDTIESMTQYRFFFMNEDIDLNRKITIKAVYKSLPYVLSQFLKGGVIDYKIMNNQILIKKRVPEKLPNQSYKIEGTIIDAETGEPIYNCALLIGGTYSRTSTNELGEFVINVTSFPAALTLSHINYETKTLTLSDTTSQNITLTPLINSLEEVVINDNDPYAIDLALKAFNKTTESSIQKKFGKAFYRQTSKNDNDYSEFSEIIYDLQYSSAGILDWDIIEGRYALKQEKVNNKNYTLFSQLLKALQPETNDIFFPLNQNLEKLYTIKILEKIKSKDKLIVVLWFRPKAKSAAIPLFEGEVYIDAKTYNVLKVTGEIARDDLKLIRFTERGAEKRAYKLSYQMAFKVDPDLGLAIDYMDVNQEFDYFKDNKFQTHVSSKSSLNFFEYYTAGSRKKLGRQFKRNSSDWNRLNEIGYNKKFWEDNPIVKRTPLEEEVIESFEKDDAFESIFLNSRNQIAAAQSNISNTPFITDLTEGLILYNNYNPVEKVYLHTDKDIGSPGEDIWYSAYVVLGAYHQSSLTSKVLYVDVINPSGQLILTQKQEITEGKSAGVISLPENLKAGTYQLRSYTDWMRNEDAAFFFTKTIKVVKESADKSPHNLKKDKLDLQFFPEGGYAIAGLNNTIAFKGVDSNGLAKPLEGTIRDTKGNTVTHMRSIHKGAGLFTLNPKKGETYKVVLEDQSEVLLPTIQNQGYVLSVDNRNVRSIGIKVQATADLKDRFFYIIGHIRNQKYYQAQLGFGGKDIVDFEIPKNHFPSGVMTLTLLDEEMKPWCERALFIDNQEELVINASLDKKDFKPRDKITLNIQVTDVNGQPVSTALSVAVTDANKTMKSPNSSNILTHLLLESDVRGYIDNPAFYFQDRKLSTRSKLDLVMLTHGWRRFNWITVKNKIVDSLKKFPLAQGLPISGIIRDEQNFPLKNIAFDMIAKSSDRFKLYPAKTDSNGRFDILDFNHKDTTQLAFNLYNKKGSLIQGTVFLDKNEFDPPVSSFRKYDFKKILPDGESKEFLRSVQLKKREDSLFDLRYSLKKSLELDEVLLKGKAAEKKPISEPSFYGVEPDSSVLITEKNNLGDLIFVLAKLPGVRVLGTGNEAKVSIQRTDGPLWIVDGIPIFNENARQGSSGALLPFPSNVVKIPSFINGLSLTQILKIEVLRPAKASIYGARGSGGAISISTRRGTNFLFEDDTKEDKSLWTHTTTAYTAVKEFYAPKYSVEKPEHEKKDYRTTLHWTPTITTDKNGKASIVFFNSDSAKYIQIYIEGLSKKGIPGTSLKIYE